MPKRAFPFVVSVLLLVILCGHVRISALQDPPSGVNRVNPQSSERAPGVVWKMSAPGPIRSIELRREFLTVMTLASGLEVDTADGHVSHTFQSGGEEIATFEGLMFVAESACECQPVLTAKRIGAETAVWRSTVELSTSLSMPAVTITDDGTGLVRGGDGRIHAVDLRTGALRWSAGLSRSIPAPWNVPAAVGALAFTVGGDRALHALDVSTGDERWTFRAPDSGEVSAPTVAGDVMFISGRHHLFALDPVSGAVRWSVPIAGFVVTSPVTDGSHVYVEAFASDRDSRTSVFIYAIDIARTTVARFELPATVPASSVLPTAWTPTLVARKGVLYVASPDDQVMAVRTSAEFVPVSQPSQSLPPVSSVSSATGPRPVAAGRASASYDVLVNDENRRVLAIRADGSRRTTIANAGHVFPESCSPGGRFAALQDDRDVHLVDLSTGRSQRVTVGPFSGLSWLSDSELLVFPYGGEPGSGVLRTVTAVDVKTLRTRPFSRIDDGAVTSPAVSPDGRRVLFVSWDTNGPNLYVADVSGANRKALTQSGDVLPLGFSWSPNGDRVGYETELAPAVGPDSGARRGAADALARLTRRLYVARPDGTDSRLVASGVLFYPFIPYEWSADGARLLLMTGALIRHAACRPVLEATTSPIMCADRIDITGDHIVGLHFSPDEREILRVTGLPMGRNSLTALNFDSGARGITRPDESIGDSISVCR